ncbi:uncharacterized protein LOC127702452 [Mytilus californianus]|uniref:uncharacterized protein LOC127702452 n=1 Tax=Mytilus californianus TaxID=6549 RepID=UPI002245CF02|nr:uncharacterized protein LOC127702452 [Mytilus californianus]XP_052062616.1 uncharacterized protein LOC127702452 [Mytilus californianus]
MVMRLIILTVIVIKGLEQHELDLSPNNGTLVPTGNNLTITCSVRPCNETGSVLLFFGHAEKLFSGICDNEIFVYRRRYVFSCNSTQCTYTLNVYDVDVTDQRQMICTYRSSSQNVINKTTTIRISDFPGKPTIEPEGPFYLTQEVNLTCSSTGGNPVPRMIFSCNGENGREKMKLDKVVEYYLSLRMDSHMVNTVCTCVVIQSQNNYKQETTFYPIIYSDNFTTISPPGPYVDGESIDFKCCFGKVDSPRTNLSFQCHGEYVSQQINNVTCLYLNVTIDIDKYRTKCTCIAQSKDMSINVSSDIQLVINRYDPAFELSPFYKVVFGNTTTLTCLVPGLQYPFAFGNWQYKKEKEEKKLKGSISSNTTTVLTVSNSTYVEMGTYYCTVVDERKNDTVVANASTELKVEGPIALKKIHSKQVNNTRCMLIATFESFPKIEIKSLWESNKQIEFRQSILNSNGPERKDKPTTKQQANILLVDCLSSTIYGMVVSNDIFTEKFYFDMKGVIFKMSRILKMDEQFIDGKLASMTCYDITQSELSNLDLSCDNITSMKQDIVNDAASIRTEFIADIKDDGTKCRCNSNQSESESILQIHIVPYKGHNVSYEKDVCESNSEIKLVCQDENLPDVFHFGKWIHHYNDVEIGQRDGFSSRKQTSIQIPFCTYEDIGNYTCTVTDSRKNTTVFNSTVFLNVPGPPVIVNSSIVKDNSKAECVLSVHFYSFDENPAINWYKNGKLLHSSERQRPNVSPTTHYVNMHNTEVPVKAKIATLHLKPGCDVETSIYRFTVKTADFSTSHTFKENDNTVRKVLILSLIIASGIFIAGLIITICRATKGTKDKFWQIKKSLNSTVARRRIDTQFYEEVGMVIANIRQADEGNTGHNRDTLTDSNYEQIPFDRN